MFWHTGITQTAERKQLCLSHRRSLIVEQRVCCQRAFSSASLSSCRRHTLARCVAVCATGSRDVCVVPGCQPPPSSLCMHLRLAGHALLTAASVKSLRCGVERLPWQHGQHVGQAHEKLTAQRPIDQQVELAWIYLRQICHISHISQNIGRHNYVTSLHHQRMNWELHDGPTISETHF